MDVKALFKRSQLDEELDHRVSELASMDVDSQEYTTAVRNVQTLTDIKRNDGVNKNTLVTAGASVLCVVLMIGFELVTHGTFTTKAMSYAPRVR